MGGAAASKSVHVESDQGAGGFTSSVRTNAPRSSGDREGCSASSTRSLVQSTARASSALAGIGGAGGILACLPQILSIFCSPKVTAAAITELVDRYPDAMRAKGQPPGTPCPTVGALDPAVLAKIFAFLFQCASPQQKEFLRARGPDFILQAMQDSNQ